MEIGRGEVWIANVYPSRGTEVGKVRPVLILQHDRVTREGLDTVVMAPLTSRIQLDAEPLRIAIQARERLLKPSQVMVDKIRALDRRRFVEGPIARLTDEEMARVERSLKGLLGLQ